MHAWATRESSRSSPLSGHRPPVVANLARRPARSALSLALPLPLYASPLCFPFTVPYFAGFFLSFRAHCDRLVPLAPLTLDPPDPYRVPSHYGTYLGGMILHLPQSRHAQRLAAFGSGNTNNSLLLGDWAPWLDSCCARPSGDCGDLQLLQFRCPSPPWVRFFSTVGPSQLLPNVGVASLAAVVPSALVSRPSGLARNQIGHCCIRQPL